MKRLVVVLALALACSGSDEGVGLEGDRAGSQFLGISNRSSHTLIRLQLAEPGTGVWGDDQLAGPMEPDGLDFEFQVPCDVYDVKLVDADANECVLEELDLCVARWVVTDGTCDW